MDRHVIKGRGANRGKYLCWARMAPGEKPTEDGFVWLPEQRKACRWEDPRYSGKTWATGRAVAHGGYFVKLVAPKAIVARVEELQSFIRVHADGAPEKTACYWFGGDFHDAGENFCRECAEKLVDEKYAADPKAFENYDCETEEERYRTVIDGGFDTDHDSPPYCQTCEARLSGHLTNHGADEEIDALTGDCAPAFNFAYGWDQLDDALCNVSKDDPRWRLVARVVDAAMAAEREHEGAQAALAATPGMAEARAGFLSLLGARAEQKAPEPSFLPWDEFQAWMLVRHEKTPEVEATEKRLAKEAIVFLRHCGIGAYMTNSGMVMAEAAHGTYYWPFIVEAEQRKLWKDVDLAAGRVVGLACLLDGAPGRDANPFALNGPDAARSRAWDNGFSIGLSEACGKAKGGPQ